jgi:hypothetical protein
MSADAVALSVTARSSGTSLLVASPFLAASWSRPFEGIGGEPPSFLLSGAEDLQVPVRLHAAPPVPPGPSWPFAVRRRQQS